MSDIDHQRPSKLYFFADRNTLERALSLGEFRLTQPAPDGDASVPCLTLSMTSDHDSTLFDHVTSDAYLVIHNAEEFGERVHRAAQRTLPNWAGIDAAISYGAPSQLGRAFSKAKSRASEREWRFAWRPMQANASLHPVVIQIGSLQDIAELHTKNH